MERTIVEALQTRIKREFDELKHEVLGLMPRAKGWRQTVGKIPDDELSHSTEKLGREWREQGLTGMFVLISKIHPDPLDK